LPRLLYYSRHLLPIRYIHPLRSHLRSCFPHPLHRRLRLFPRFSPSRQHQPSRPPLHQPLRRPQSQRSSSPRDQVRSFPSPSPPLLSPPPLPHPPQPRHIPLSSSQRALLSSFPPPQPSPHPLDPFPPSSPQIPHPAPPLRMLQSQHLPHPPYRRLR